MTDALDPGTMFGSIVGQIIAGLLIVALATLFTWVLGPLRWWWYGRIIRRIILSGRAFRFVFDPGQNRSKTVRFMPDGGIGDGRNSNECSWRIKRGKLCILAFDGRTYSRFKFDPANGRLTHTNETDCRSILGQYFEPLFKPWSDTGD